MHVQAETCKKSTCLKVLGLLLELAELGRAVVLPPDAGVEVSGVSQPADVRDGKETGSLIDVLDSSSPVTDGTSQSTNVDQSQTDVSGTEEEGRPESVQTELNPVEGEGLLGGVTAKTGRSAVESLDGQVGSPTHGSVEDGPNDAIVAGRGVEARLLERFVPHRVGRVVGRLGGQAVNDTYSDGDSNGEDGVAGLSQRGNRLERECHTCQHGPHQHCR